MKTTSQCNPNVMETAHVPYFAQALGTLKGTFSIFSSNYINLETKCIMMKFELEYVSDL